ncbi:Ig-like domain repeat protein [Rhodococcus maanshanensis]|uniref:Ig-like domain (Group 3) n=2 Tax=Rhodococcus maanshanensis TaxID=183556 RepID=A0A1H7FD46_9NOCA|nr:Ig-like domain repeat protein [Rhodococcus maanshanensis]SEK23217.1 Ig-like domain (group 3) [Rhodococcus maanshanensis]
MRSTRARRAAMIGTAALLLVAPCATLAQAEPAAPAPALPADMVAAIQRDLRLSPAQYLERAETGQELATFADTLRGKFPTAYAGAWLDPAGTPLVGLADGPDKAAARTAVEAAGFKVKDQSRSENALSDLLGQLNTWIQQLPAPLAGLVNGTAIDPVNNDIALNVKDTAAGQGLQLPDFLNFVRVAQEPAGPSALPGFGSLGSSDPTKPTKPTTTKPAEPTTTKPTTTKPTDPAAATTTLDPIAGATVGKATTLKAKINPAAAGGTVVFSDGAVEFEPVPVGADGTATADWFPDTAGTVTITATFSGRDGVAGSTTTAQVTVAPADNNPATSTITLDPIKGATVGKATTLKAKVNNPAAADGTVEFKDGTTVLTTALVNDDGTSTFQWTPTAAGQRTITATFSGFENVALATTTAQVTVAGPPKPTTTKPKPPAANAIMGGDTYDFVGASGGSHMCTLAFNATDASGHAAVLTAGHCDPNEPDSAGTDRASIGHEVVGGERGVRFGEAVKTAKAPLRLDYSVIKIDDTFAKRFENNYVRVPRKAPLAITGTADPVEGAPVCMSGQTTGYHCGTIKVAVTGDPRGGHTTGRFAVRICGLGGDSGSPMITGTEALGITGQSNIMTLSQSECEEMMADPDVPDGYKPTVKVTPIKEILKDNPGLKIRTN